MQFRGPCPVFGLLSVLRLPTYHAMEGSAAPLFACAPDHPNITCLTDKNWASHFAANDKPWLVDFYHPFCPHCQKYVPEWIKIAAYYKQNGSVNIGALSCMTEYLCRKQGIDSFPTLNMYHFNPRQVTEQRSQPDPENEFGQNGQLIGSHTLEQVVPFVNNLLVTGAYNASHWDEFKALQKEANTRAGEMNVTEEWEDSVALSNRTTRLQDAASALMVGLNQWVFLGREELDEGQLDALKSWLQVVAATFPGTFNRQLLVLLYDEVSPMVYLNVTIWEQLLYEWRELIRPKIHHQLTTLSTLPDVPEWQRTNVFATEGDTYIACDSYTCGQWHLFHLMTINPTDDLHSINGSTSLIIGHRTDTLLMNVMTAIRSYMANFYPCVQSRGHFLKKNTLKKIYDFKRSKDKRRFLKTWLWKLHNKVNTRIGHPVWPKLNATDCNNCLNNNTIGYFHEPNVIAYLSSVYGYSNELEMTHTQSWFPELSSTLYHKYESIVGPDNLVMTVGDITEPTINVIKLFLGMMIMVIFGWKCCGRPPPADETQEPKPQPHEMTTLI